MSHFNQVEIDIIRECLLEIINEKYFSALHEQKKKLVSLTSKEGDIDSRLSKCLSDIQKLRETRHGRRLLSECRDAETQTDKPEQPDESFEDKNKSSTTSVAQSSTQTNDNSERELMGPPPSRDSPVASTSSSASLPIRHTSETASTSTSTRDAEMTDEGIDEDPEHKNLVEPKLEVNLKTTSEIELITIDSD